AAPSSEYGTRNTTVLLGFAAAVDFLTAVGRDAAMARAASLADRLRTGLEPLNGVDMLTPADPASRAAILAFKLPDAGGDPWDWCNMLRREHDMRLRPVGEAGLNAVRASTHLFNSEDEVDRLVEVLATLL
ncbi:MAG: aminotransferase class V-fold PLP-dependent enzyme, partial [Gemmatimonadota bacterium]